MSDVDGVVAEGDVATKFSDTEHDEFIVQNANKDIVVSLIEMGFSHLRSVKAVFLTQNAGLEQAADWLADHEDDDDIDEPLHVTTQDSPKPKLSPEEAELRARELQKRIREERLKKEKQDEIDRERRRIESTKAVQDALRAGEEQQRQRAIDEMQREKQRRALEIERQQELLRRDYEERFGVPYPDRDERSSIQTKSKKDQLAFYSRQLRSTYSTSDPEGLRTCVQTLLTYIKNVYDNPMDKKFCKIRKTNAAFSTRVAQFTGAISMLEVVGFAPEGDYLEIEGLPDRFTLSVAIKILEAALRGL